MDTKELIIETTRKLCNEHRASTVTTNHIAAAAGIRSGNLYYHFKNKESIVREIYFDMFQKADELWYEPSFQTSEYGIVNYLVRLNTLLYEYRFCFRELNLVMSRDPELKSMYRARSVKLLAHINKTFDSWIAADMMKPFGSAEERRSVIDNFHIGMLFWISYVDLWDDEITPKIISRGIRHFMLYFKPYFRPKVVRLIEKLLNSAVESAT
ncbi:MAG: TetR/AcrR family transcriptional regulator [Solirubrobacterales bacterium]